MGIGHELTLRFESKLCHLSGFITRAPVVYLCYMLHFRLLGLDDRVICSIVESSTNTFFLVSKSSLIGVSSQHESHSMQLVL